MVLLTVGAIIGELHTPVQKKQIHDVGFRIADAIPKHIFENDYVIALNSIILLLCIGYVVWEGYFYGVTSTVQEVFILYSLRFVVGFMTRLPIPHDAYHSPADVPPKGSNFFFLFSAHTATITTVALHVCESYNMHVVFVIVLVLQSMRLLSTRGHYSADIIIAVALSMFLYY